MRSARAAAVLALSALALPACDEPTGTQIADLAGFWNATQFEYDDISGDAPGFGFDAVRDTTGTVALAIDEGGSFTGSVEIPGATLDPQTGQTVLLTIGGTISLIDPTTLSIDFDEGTESLGLFRDLEADFSLQADMLTLVSDETTFDFPDALEESTFGESRGPVPATLTATLIR